jgi:hypothetical protein
MPSISASSLTSSTALRTPIFSKMRARCTSTVLWSSMLQASNLTTFAQPTTDRMNRFQILHFDFEKSAAKRFKPPLPPDSDDDLY